MNLSSLPKIAHALGLAPTASGTEIIAAVVALKNDVATARSAATHAVILTGNDISTIAKAVGLPATATKDELVAAIRKLDGTKTGDANALRLIALTLGLPSEASRADVIAEISTWAPAEPSAVDLISHRAHWIAEHSEGRLTFGVALDQAAREFPQVAAAAATERTRRARETAFRALEQHGEPATGELIAAVNERMASKRLTFAAALVEVGRERPDLVAGADVELVRRQSAQR